ncbi:polyhydroxyalkanoate depolymerase, partial [Acinetobacter baumannii]
VPVDGKPVGITEEVVEEKPFCRLIHFKKDLSARQSAALKQPTVLVVAPLSGHHSTLLRETVRALLQEHDVFITDWTDARMVPVEAGEFHLHDYV